MEFSILTDFYNCHEIVEYFIDSEKSVLPSQDWFAVNWYRVGYESCISMNFRIEL